MVIAPDRRGTGTNALLVSHCCEFRFGERSYARHLLLAAERGWTAVVVSRPELAFDLDTPADFAAWPGGSRLDRQGTDAIVRA
jgi:2-phospho-L-lactate guanylyltransferase